MKKFWLTFCLFLTVSLFYFLFIPIKIYKKNIFHVDNYFEIHKLTESTYKYDGYFFSNNECGYFSIDNGMTHYKKVDGNKYIKANNLFYLIYEKVGDSIKIFLPNGEMIATTPTYGYPYISGEFPFFYVIKTNAMGFSLYDIKGKALIKDINFTSIISSINMDKNINTLVSTIDGTTYLYSSKGKKIFQTESYNSKIKISKSNAIDMQGDYLAICSGIEPEYIEIYKRKTNKIITKFKTETNFRYNSFLHFVNDKIYYEGLEEIKFYKIKKKKHGTIKIKGLINEIIFSPDGNILVASSDNDIYYLTIYSSDGEKEYYKEFLEPISNFKYIDKNVFYFKLEDMVLKMLLGEPT